MQSLPKRQEVPTMTPFFAETLPPPHPRKLPLQSQPLRPFPSFARTACWTDGGVDWYPYADNGNSWCALCPRADHLCGSHVDSYPRELQVDWLLHDSPAAQAGHPADHGDAAGGRRSHWRWARPWSTGWQGAADALLYAALAADTEATPAKLNSASAICS